MASSPGGGGGAHILVGLCRGKNGGSRASSSVKLGVSGTDCRTRLASTQSVQAIWAMNDLNVKKCWKWRSPEWPKNNMVMLRSGIFLSFVKNYICSEWEILELKMGSLARHIPNMHTYGSEPPPPPPRAPELARAWKWGSPEHYHQILWKWLCWNNGGGGVVSGIRYCENCACVAHGYGRLAGMHSGWPRAAMNGMNINKSLKTMVSGTGKWCTVW